MVFGPFHNGWSCVFTNQGLASSQQKESLYTHLRRLIYDLNQAFLTQFIDGWAVPIGGVAKLTV
jgi:hypothetical protein